MAPPPPSAISPSGSGTSTPTTTSALTQAGIVHQQPSTTASPLAPLSASKITTTLVPPSARRVPPPPNSPEVFTQRTCTDHMIQASWNHVTGWSTPTLQPYGPLSLMPTASVLHYATECFEGLKLYRGFDGRLRLFRPRRNAERMRRSVARIALPDFEASELEALIVRLCAVDGPRWLTEPGSFLYVRPTMIGTDPSLGVQRPKEALLYVVLACFPDMSRNLATVGGGVVAANGNGEEKKSDGLKLLASNEDTIRAWPGGFGYAKLGANYGPSLVAQGEARTRGFDQVLWLFGKEGFVTEAGASNFFVVWRTKDTGKLQLVTAPLTERIILEGVTRASVLDLAHERLAGPELEVVEQQYTMDQLVEAHREGRLVEAFACGTAFFIAPIDIIHYRGEDIKVSKDDGSSYAHQMKQWLMDIMYGRVEHPWGLVIEEIGST